MRFKYFIFSLIELCILIDIQLFEKSETSESIEIIILEQLKSLSIKWMSIKLEDTEH